jgi:succinate dehydrogenase/fumarate reductase flavoprotein subunit
LTALQAASGGSHLLALSLPHLLTMAKIIVRAALKREESRGPHYRIDFPERDDAACGQSIVVKQEAGGRHLLFRKLG